MATASNDYVMSLRVRTLGVEEAQSKVLLYGQSVRSASREAFRYTYYAMAALRLGQALFAGAVLRGVLRPAEEAAIALGRVSALSEEAAGGIEKLERAASRAAMATPFTFAEITGGVEELYRAGRSFTQAIKDVEEVAKLATISRRTIGQEASFMGAIMTAYSKDVEGGILTTRTAVDQLARAMTLSRYTVGDLQSALENAMDSAAGFNQTFTQTLTLITAIARGGAPAAQAGTMVRQLLMRFGRPETLAFYEAAMEYWQEQTGRVAPEIFTPTGEYADLGRVVVAAAEALEFARKEWEAWGEGAEFARARSLLLQEVFGIRQVRFFLSLANLAWEDHAGKIYRGVEAYDKLQEELRKATEGLGYAEEYLDRLRASWEMARQQWSTTAREFARQLGAPMLQVLDPLVRGMTEFVFMLGLLGQRMPVFSRTLSVVTLTGGAMTMLAGGLGIVTGLMLLFKSRLHDIGLHLTALERTRIVTMFGLRPRPGETFIAPSRLAMYSFWAKIIGPLRIVAALVGVITVGFLAWQYNLGGLRDKFGTTFARIQKDLQNTTRLGERAANAVASWFQAPAWQAFWRGGFRPPSARPRFQVGGPEGTFMPWEVARVAQAERVGLFWRGLDRAVAGFVKALDEVTRGLVTFGGIVARVVGSVFYGMAWVLGLGNVERGFERMGMATALLALTAVLNMTITLTMRLTRALMWLNTRGFRLLIRGIMRFFGIPTRVITSSLALVTRGVRYATHALLSLMIGRPGFLMGRTGDIFFARLGQLGRLIFGPRMWITMLDYITRPMVHLLHALRTVNVTLRAGLLPALWRLLTWLYTMTVGRAINWIKGGALIGLMGGMGRGMGGIMGMLGAFLIPGMKYLLPILLGAGVLAGLGYGIYRLVAGSRGMAAPVSTAPPSLPPLQIVQPTLVGAPAGERMAAPVPTAPPSLSPPQIVQPAFVGAPAGGGVNFTFAPTILVRETTTERQAQEIVDLAVEKFHRVRWEEEGTRRERYLRGHLYWDAFAE